MIIKNQEKAEMLTREERVREIQKFTLLSDVFMSVALEPSTPLRYSGRPLWITPGEFGFTAL